MTEIDWTHYFFAIAVLAMLLGGLGLFSLAVRKGWILQNMTGLRALTQGHRRRLALKETLVIDPRRRVVILQADEMEHIVLLGAEAETVLASQTAPTQPVAVPATAEAAS